MIRQSKKEGGRGRVLWIEKSGVHPRSGLEHGRSAQQELNEEGGQGTTATYLFDAGPDTILAVRTDCCTPSSPGRRGAVPGFSWQCAVRQSHPRHTDGWVGGSRCNYRVLPCATRGFTSGSAAGSFAQSRLPDCDCAAEDEDRFLWYCRAGSAPR